MIQSAVCRSLGLAHRLTSRMILFGPRCWCSRVGWSRQSSTWADPDYAPIKGTPVAAGYPLFANKHTLAFGVSLMSAFHPKQTFICLRAPAPPSPLRAPVPPASIDAQETVLQALRCAMLEGMDQPFETCTLHHARPTNSARRGSVTLRTAPHGQASQLPLRRNPIAPWRR